MKTQDIATSINEVHWENGLTYEEYKNLIAVLLNINKTTGDDHSEKRIVFTKLNEQRMNKWDKIGQINPDLAATIQNINAPQKWLILTEAWCGDAAQNIPFINKMVALNPNIELRLLLRDENLDIMDAYLTNGARAIPKLIIMNKDLKELATWGPRPQPVQQNLVDYKSGKITKDVFEIAVHSWYAKDRGNTLQKEFDLMLTK